MTPQFLHFSYPYVFPTLQSKGALSGGCFGCGASPPKYTKPVSSSVLSTPAKQRGNPATELKVSKKAASKDEGPQTKSRKSTRIANRAARVLTK